MRTLNKVTVLGDSLALPRPEDKIFVDDIYPTKLSAIKNVVVFNKAKVSADTEALLEGNSLYYDIRYSNSQFFVLHVGICDCAPRLFTKGEKRFLNILSEISILSNSVNYYISSKSKERMYHTRKRNIVNVPLSIFKSNYIKVIEEIIKYNPIKKLFLVNIANHGVSLVERSYNVQSLITSYNEVIYDVYMQYRSISELIDINEFTKNNVDTILKDGYHISSKTHSFIYKTIAQSIMNLCI